MKYLFIGLAIIAVVGVFCMINGAIVDDRLGEIEEAVAEALEKDAYGDTAGALEHMKHAAELFDEQSFYLTTMLMHRGVDDAYERINVARRLLETGEDTADTLPAAYESIKLLRKEEKLLPGNIF